MNVARSYLSTIGNGDSEWICEALINIIKNCVEHTRVKGKVDIELMENPIYNRITISDNCEGIGKQDLPNIFKRFYKSKTSKNSESIGIGLALTKSIMESHNVMINVQSTFGKGTKFIITFLKY